MLRRLMQQAGINSIQLADKMMLDRKLVRDWELGKKRPPAWIYDKAKFQLQREGLIKR